MKILPEPFTTGMTALANQWNNAGSIVDTWAAWGGIRRCKGIFQTVRRGLGAGLDWEPLPDSY